MLQAFQGGYTRVGSPVEGVGVGYCARLCIATAIDEIRVLPATIDIVCDVDWMRLPSLDLHTKSHFSSQRSETHFAGCSACMLLDSD